MFCNISCKKKKKVYLHIFSFCGLEANTGFHLRSADGSAFVLSLRRKYIWEQTSGYLWHFSSKNNSCVKTRPWPRLEFSSSGPNVMHLCKGLWVYKYTHQNRYMKIKIPQKHTQPWGCPTASCQAEVTTVGIKSCSSPCMLVKPWITPQHPQLPTY